MQHRNISAAQASAIVKIVTEECGYGANGYSDETFARTIATAGKKHICHEYRFCGALGFGGKFRNNGNHDNTPYVDCYREHETPERLAMIEAANTKIAALFEH